MLNTLLENLSALIFPVECEICGTSLNPDPPTGVCESCVSRIRKIAAPHCHGCGRSCSENSSRCASCSDENFAFDRAFACSYYEGNMRELIHAYKFKNRKYLKHFFINRMQQFVASYLSENAFDAVLPVPSGLQRFLDRGFNPPELISKELAKNLGLPHLNTGLTRIGSESAQALLSKTARKQNVRGVFFTPKPEIFHSKNLLLIDDILTTGETASECARTLKKAGASQVTVLTLARGV